MADEVVKKKKKAHASRQKWLTGGIPRYSRSQMYVRAARYKAKHVPTRVVKKKVPTMVLKNVGGEKNGGTRLVRVRRLPRYYPTEPKPRRLNNRMKPFSKHKRNLRSSLTPGTVVILLRGHHKARRVIFMKQLASGLLLVNGPLKLNRCPLRRINQIYVIATKTKIDISEVIIPKRVDDEYFRRVKVKRPRNKQGEIFDEEKDATYKLTDERREDQKIVDRQLLPIIKKMPSLVGYLKTQFQLHTKQYPHKIIF